MRIIKQFLFHFKLWGALGGKVYELDISKKNSICLIIITGNYYMLLKLERENFKTV